MQTNLFLLLDFDKQIIERQVYTIADWMKDVGGFHATMHLLVTLVLPFFQVWSLDKYFISQNYVVQPNVKN
jgi:hypothetical protein